MERNHEVWRHCPLSKINPFGFKLSGSVGIGGKNKAADVEAAKTLIKTAGFLSNPKTPKAEADPDFQFDIQRFQTANGLKMDGVMNPGGETEKKLTSNPPSSFDNTGEENDRNKAENAANSDSTACSKLQTQLDDEKLKWDVEWSLVQGQDAIVKDLRAKLDSAVTDFRDQGQLRACENAAKGVKAMAELVISRNPLSAFSSIIDYITSSAAGIRENWKNLDEIGNIDEDFDKAGTKIRELWRKLKKIDGDIAVIKKDMENRNCEIGLDWP